MCLKWRPMNVYSSSSPALPHQYFYILLALLREDLHIYAIYGAVGASSMGTVRMSQTRAYTAISQLVSLGLAEEAGWAAAGKQERPRMTYRITPEGRLRLKDDLKRMRYAVEIGDSAGMLNDELPSDIQQLLNQLG